MPLHKRSRPLTDSTLANNSITMRTTCRVCGSQDIINLFTLGNQYVSNFVPQDQIKTGVQCPIDIIMCQGCTLVQQRYTAPQDLLYTRKYWYRSGVTDTMRTALRSVTKHVEASMNLYPGDVLLDIGSNDGTLLRSYETPGVIKVGVEPATNLAQEGKEGVDLFINDFWQAETFLAVTNGRRAKAITACGMLYDLEDPNQFIGDVAKALAPGGIFLAQLMCLRNMLDVTDLGNLAHEHLEFYSLRSLEHLLNRHGLTIYDVFTNDVNGQSYRLVIGHKSAPPQAFRMGCVDRVKEAVQAEEGLDRPEKLYGWFGELEYNKARCVEYITTEVREHNRRVWVYGASTKGNVILQYYNLDYTVIEAAADRSPEKCGLYTVGTGIPIRSEEEARDANPDYFLVLPYAFLPEFMAREAAWRKKGGRFIVPLPRLKIV